MIEIKNLSKEYKGRCVLSIPALKFDNNKIYALIGANGSGKSTLLRILAGVLSPDSGTVDICLSNKHAFGYLPQRPYGFGFSVQKNVEIALDNVNDRAETAKAALSAVGMLKITGRRGDTLSGGETQRMAFARIIACPSEMILLDEPTSASDIEGIDLIETALLGYQKKQKCTVVFSTHIPAQALRLADYVIFFESGVIAEQGSAKQVLTQPKNEVTKRFLMHWRI